MHNEMFNEVIELLKVRRSFCSIQEKLFNWLFFLERKGFLSQKFIFFHRDVGTQKTAQLKQIAEKHGAKIVHAPQNATHVSLDITMKSSLSYFFFCTLKMKAEGTRA